ncbi:MAG: alpha/beta hydrolase [Alphaproteobacteria bacterium]|nr:alpha/beta hydrolase [Alphaproteobacteria bacterium]
MNKENFDISKVDFIQIGEGPDIMLLHSLLSDRTVFELILDELSKEYRLTLPNLPGYGDTPELDLTNPELFDLADFIHVFMNSLDLPNDTAVLGNGAGGFIAVALAIRYGTRIGKLILADTGPAFSETDKTPLRLLANRVETAGMEVVLDAAMARMFPQNYIKENPEIVEKRKAILATCNPVAFASTARALADADMAGDLIKINNETMVMVGLEDETTPPIMSYALKNGIQKSMLIEIPGCGHCPQIQSRDIFVSELLSFLQA